MAFVRYASLSKEGNWYRITSVHKTQALANAGVVGDTAYTGNVSDSVQPEYWVNITNGNIEKAVPNTDSAELTRMKEIGKFVYNWLTGMHTELDYYGQYYDDAIWSLGHNSLAQKYRGIWIVLNRRAPSVASLTIAQRIAFLLETRKGMRDAANAQQFYTVAVALAEFRRSNERKGNGNLKFKANTPYSDLLRTPISPIVWVNPKANPISRIKLQNVIDFSGASGFTDDEGTKIAGLGLTSAHANLAVDYSTTDWIDKITS